MLRGIVRAVPAACGSQGSAAASKQARLLSDAVRESKILLPCGVSLHVVESGDASARPILCMPGALGTAATDFAYQLEDLSQLGYRVISFDPRGYGKSRPPVRDFPQDFYRRDAEDASGIITALGLESCGVMGWSDGANAAVLLAAEHPAQVDKLAIFGGNSFVTAEDIAAYEATRDVQLTWSTGMKNKHYPVYGHDLQTMWDSFCDAMKRIHAAGGNICQDEAKRIECKTLVLHGLLDPIVPTSHALWFEKHIPNAFLHTFPEGKHNIHIKYNKEFNSLMNTFF